MLCWFSREGENLTCVNKANIREKNDWAPDTENRITRTQININKLKNRDGDMNATKFRMLFSTVAIVRKKKIGRSEIRRSRTMMKDI